MTISTLSFSLLLVTLSVAVTSSEIQSQTSLAVTIYNNQFAMVKDVRKISFDQGRSDLYFTDVSSNIQPQTVTFKAKDSADEVTVFEQNYQANLVNARAVLEKYIGKEVIVFGKFGKESKQINGTVLGYSQGVILQTDNGIEVISNVEGVRFPSLPQGFFTKPTLNWKVFSKKKLTTDCEVAYRTTGFSWKADYSLTLNKKQDKADLGGWVTIDNRSGKRYLNAKLKLIAGDVNTVTPQPEARMLRRKSAQVNATAPSGFAQKSFSDFHLYTLSEPTSLNDNSQKQIEFIPKVYGMSIRKYNQIDINSGSYSQTGLKASNKVQFVNNKDNKLGIPFPKGTVRLFKQDEDDGSLQFLGEDSIDHTPKDQKITVNTGNAFDITADKRVSNFRSFEKGGYTADLNLTVTNHKQVEAEIQVRYRKYHGDNLALRWEPSNVAIEKVSAEEWKLKRVFAANEKYSYLWHEDYRP